MGQGRRHGRGSGIFPGISWFRGGARRRAKCEGKRPISWTAIPHESNVNNQCGIGLLSSFLILTSANSNA
jgi:hypothetical protein